jgi:hypothetical protein
LRIEPVAFVLAFSKPAGWLTSPISKHSGTTTTQFSGWVPASALTRGH